MVLLRKPSVIKDFLILRMAVVFVLDVALNCMLLFLSWLYTFIVCGLSGEPPKPSACQVKIEGGLFHPRSLFWHRLYQLF